ncbi:MAG: OmpA family protein [Spirochaetales bacterium]|nr:OmpA family protein [Spirochaetales bacterium]
MAFTDADFISKEDHELDYVLRKWRKRGTAANRAVLVEALDRFNADKAWEPHTRAKFYEFAERDGLIGRLEGADAATATRVSEAGTSAPRRFRWWWLLVLAALVVIALLLLRYCGACSSPSVVAGVPAAAAAAPAAGAPAAVSASAPAPSAPADAVPAKRALSLEALPAASLSIRFLPDSSELLAPGSEAALPALAAALKAFDGGTLVLVGHAAGVGRPEGELRVSEGRARFVASFLETAGLPSGLAIRIEARGSSEPVTVPGGVEASRAASRRVEVRVE